MLAIRVIANDAEPTDNLSFIRDKLFGSGTTFGSQYMACSLNQLDMEPTTDIGTFSSLIDGVIEIDIGTNVANESTTTIEALVDVKMAEIYETTWADNLDHYIYILPPGTVWNTVSPWVGTSRFWVE